MLHELVSVLCRWRTALSPLSSLRTSAWCSTPEMLNCLHLAPFETFSARVPLGHWRGEEKLLASLYNVEDLMSG